VAIISNAVTIADAGAFSVGLGSMTLIKTLTASSSGTLSFVHGASSVVLDNTYPIYKFEFIDIHPATNEAYFSFQVDTGTNTNYNIAVTSTAFDAYNYESGGTPALTYRTGNDQAQGTAFQRVTSSGGSDNDQNFAGTIHLYDPSSATFVKHFMCTSNTTSHDDSTANSNYAGYFNTTTALTRVQFKMSSGNIDSGKIKLYGIKDS
jgi:hypothetical protein